jgi:trans-aconitate 2-methyltransferase
LLEWHAGNFAFAAGIVAQTRDRGSGCLAVQIPNNLCEPSRALNRTIAADGSWANKLLPIAKTRPFNESMEGPYALLGSMYASVDI